MDKTTEATAPAIVPEDTGIKVLPETPEDLEAKVSALEVEKARLIEQGANYKLAYLKEKSRRDDEEPEIEEDDKMRKVVREELANSRLAEIALEQDGLIKKALKENKELKLAQLNKASTPPASVGTHSESQPVRDTLITPDQMSAFKARGWSDKDIERYKKNLQKYGGR